MIDSLSGKILEKTTSEIVVQCGGVGFLISTPLSASGALPPVGSEGTVYTVMNVSENDIQLFGFADKESRAIYRLLTSVSGVGPKVGLALVSALPPDRIALAISAGDHKTLTAANGVGPKLAQRIVLELKDKIAKGMAGSGLSLEDVSAVSSVGAGASAQAIAALASLGYSQSEAAQAVAGIDPAQPVAEIIRLALRGMGGK